MKPYPNKLKTIISDMENNFKKILTEKDYEFINDIKSLEKKYNEVYDDQNNKFSESKKEVEIYRKCRPVLNPKSNIILLILNTLNLIGNIRYLYKSNLP